MKNTILFTRQRDLHLKRLRLSGSGHLTSTIFTLHGRLSLFCEVHEPPNV